MGTISTTAASTTRRLYLPITVPFNVMSYGENQYKCYSDVYRSVHAEHNAIQKLPPQKKTKHLKKIDILVVRVNRGGSIGNSKPCLHCIWLMAQILPQKGYALKNIYYSAENGIIKDTTLTDLMEDTTPHISRYYRIRNLGGDGCGGKAAE